MTEDTVTDTPEETALPTRRRRRTSTPRGRTRPAQATGIVATLEEGVTQLIAENRRLKRQIEKMGANGSSEDGALSKSLRGIHRRIERAVVGGAPAPSRRGPGRQATRRRKAAGSVDYAARTAKRLKTMEERRLKEAGFAEPMAEQPEMAAAE